MLAVGTKGSIFLFVLGKKCEMALRELALHKYRVLELSMLIKSGQLSLRLIVGGIPAILHSTNCIILMKNTE